MYISRYNGLNVGAGDELWLIDCALLETMPDHNNGTINFNDLVGAIPNYLDNDPAIKIKFRDGDLKYRINVEPVNGDDLESVVVEFRRPNDNASIVQLFRSFASKQFLAIFFSYNLLDGQRVKLIFGNKDCGCVVKINERNSGDNYSDGSNQNFLLVNKQKTASYFLFFA